MKSMLYSISLICLLLTASQCKKENICHEDIIIENKSNTAIIASIIVRNNTGLCQLDGKTVDVEGSYKYQPFNFCIEESIGSTSLQIYIVDPSHYNNPSEFYPCDSIEVHNTVLKKYELTLEDLQAIDFRISYP